MLSHAYITIIISWRKNTLANKDKCSQFFFFYIVVLDIYSQDSSVNVVSGDRLDKSHYFKWVYKTITRRKNCGVANIHYMVRR
jgi:hypothetical protein